jgi:hypothetical protein
MDIEYGSSSSCYNRLHDVESQQTAAGGSGLGGPSSSHSALSSAESRRELNAFLLRDYAFIRRRPIAGRGVKRSIASTMVRQHAINAQV